MMKHPPHQQTLAMCHLQDSEVFWERLVTIPKSGLETKDDRAFAVVAPHILELAAMTSESS